MVRLDEAVDLVHDGRPVWRKADGGKPTVICYTEALGTWRVTESCSTKGEFARVKDPAQHPWEVLRPWKVFGGHKEYLEDPSLNG